MKDDADTETVFNAQICARIKQLREARGWTQKEVAGWLKIGIERYKKYENRSVPSAYYMQELCHLHGVSFEFLIAGISSPKRSGGKRAASR